MPSWSRKRQLLYLLVPVVLALSIFLVVYLKYVYTPPTCFDGIKNGTETGVDCGGNSCSLLCQGDSLAPVVLWAKSFNVTGNVWNAVAYVENPNIKSGAKNVPYTFNLYDQNNLLVGSRSGHIDISPNKTFAVFEAGIQVSGQTVKRTDFEFGTPITWFVDTTVEPDLTITNNPIEDGSTTPKISGTVTNPTLQTVGPLELVALILDGRQNAIGASKTVVDPLLKGQSVDFVFTWPQPFPVGVDVCQVPSNVMLVLDRSGSMASLSSNPTEPLTDVRNTAVEFLSQLHDGDNAGLISFATHPSNPIDQAITANIDHVKTAVQSIAISTSTLDRNTDIGDGLGEALTALSDPSVDSGLKKVIVLLTDGDPTDPKKAGESNYPTLFAENTAASARAQGVVIYTIGLGQDVNSEVLQNIAGVPNQFFSAPNTAVLSSIYQSIGNSICLRKPNTIEILERQL